MKQTKRISALFIALLLLLVSLVSCKKETSAYDHPEKYLTLPKLSEIEVKNSDVEENLSELLEGVLENLSGEYFTLLEDENEAVKKGDRVNITYEGALEESSSEISEEIIKVLTNKGDSKGYNVCVGADEFIEGFDEALIGAKNGDVREVTVTYTEDDTNIPELVGAKIKFKITVNSISRLYITENHAVKLKFTSELEEGIEANDEIKTLISGGVETVTLNDEDDTFNEVFPVESIKEFLIGKNKFDTVSFTLTLSEEKAAEYGYDCEIKLLISADIEAASEDADKLTDEIVTVMTGGLYTTLDEYTAVCRDMVKEDLAFGAVIAAASFSEYPEKEYNEYYSENYNSALYSVLGDIGDYTSEELAELLTEEVTEEIEKIAKENTVAELEERLLLEYLYDLLNIKISGSEYKEMLEELYSSYETEYSYMLYYYGINSAAALEDFLGKDYIVVQFSYEKLLPELKNQISFVD